MDTTSLPDVTSRMICNIASTQSAADLETDLVLIPDVDDAPEEESAPSSRKGEASEVAADGEEHPRAIAAAKDRGGRPRAAHAFLLKAQSPVFRRMLAAPMTEAAEGVVRMTGVTERQLDDLL